MTPLENLLHTFEKSGWVVTEQVDPNTGATIVVAEDNTNGGN